MPSAKQTTARKSAKSAAHPAPSMYDTAYRAMEKARAELAHAKQAFNQNRDELRTVKSALAEAVSREDFVKAESLKKVRDELEAKTSPGGMAHLSKAVEETVARVTDIYFEAHPDVASAGAATVTRVCVVDPASGLSDEAFYLDGEDGIQLSICGKQFDSEARHVARWAYDNEFLFRTFAVTVTI